ncbi:MAG: hypothetical protein P0S95_04455 [Rhabdochlamydiaceae bacterium]|nr:hypothetical protein [Candidatus Amphrikana amoebophyrae]
MASKLDNVTTLFNGPGLELVTYPYLLQSTNNLKNIFEIDFDGHPTLWADFSFESTLVSSRLPKFEYYSREFKTTSPLKEKTYSFRYYCVLDPRENSSISLEASSDSKQNKYFYSSDYNRNMEDTSFDEIYKELGNNPLLDNIRMSTLRQPRPILAMFAYKKHFTDDLKRLVEKSHITAMKVIDKLARFPFYLLDKQENGDLKIELVSQIALFKLLKPYKAIILDHIKTLDGACKANDRTAEEEIQFLHRSKL